MTRRLAAAAVAALTGLAACQQPEPQQPPAPAAEAPRVDPATAMTPVAAYRCESGVTIQARYPDQTTAELSYREQTLSLRAAEAASGARYIGAGVEWWTANREGTESATLSRLEPDNQTAGAVMERCERSPPTGDAAAVASPPPTVSVAAPAPCKGPQLKLMVEGGDAGAGNRVRNLALRNAGSQPCTLTGYPTVTAQDEDGDVLADVRAEQSPGSYFRQGQAPTTVTLAPGAKALFELAWSVMPNEAQGQKTCPDAAGVRVIVPSDTAAISAPLAFAPCGGRIRVSPLRAAS